MYFKIYLIAFMLEPASTLIWLLNSFRRKGLYGTTHWLVTSCSMYIPRCFIFIFPVYPPSSGFRLLYFGYASTPCCVAWRKSFGKLLEHLLSTMQGEWGFKCWHGPWIMWDITFPCKSGSSFLFGISQEFAESISSGFTLSSGWFQVRMWAWGRPLFWSQCCRQKL